MGIFDKFFNKRSVTFDVTNLTGGSFHLSTYSNNSIALACMDLIGISISNLPFDLYKNTKDGRAKDTKHPISSVLKLPNYNEPRSLFYYQLVQDYYNKGNIYLFKYYNDAGELYSLFRLNPDKITVSLNSSNQKIYKYDGNEYDYKKVLHIPSRYGYNGLTGQSIFDYYRNAFEIASALDNYYKASFNNGFGKGKRVILDVSELLDTSKLTKEQVEEIKAKFLNEYTGFLNADKPILKTVKNTKYETIDTGGNTNQESQLVENINVTQDLICKIFNVPSSFLKGKNEYNGLESLYVIYLDFAVSPIASALTDGFNSLLKPSELYNYYVEPNYNALMRMDTTTKIDSYVKQYTNGLLTANEIRAKENNIGFGPAGDFPQTPANLIPLSMDTINARLATQKVALQELNNTDTNNTKTGEF